MKPQISLIVIFYDFIFYYAYVLFFLVFVNLLYVFICDCPVSQVC